MTTEPLIFAHRGGAACAPEHTLEAYRLAIAAGADGLECDVRLTRDGHLVCLHDRRLDRTSDGRGPISRHTLDQLHRLDFGSWHLTGNLQPAHRGVPTPPPISEIGGASAMAARQVLTFDRLLRVARDAGRPIELLVETKHPTRRGGDVEQALCAALRRYGFDRPVVGDQVRVTVMSFSILAIRRIRRIAPGLATALLLEYIPPGMRHGSLPFGAQAAGPSVRLLRSHPYLVQRLHEHGHRVLVWTVNRPADLDLAIDVGVDGIITDHPGEAIARLRARGARR